MSRPRHRLRRLVGSRCRAPRAVRALPTLDWSPTGPTRTWSKSENTTYGTSLCTVGNRLVERINRPRSTRSVPAPLQATARWLNPAITGRSFRIRIGFFSNICRAIPPLRPTGRACRGHGSRCSPANRRRRRSHAAERAYRGAAASGRQSLRGRSSGAHCAFERRRVRSLHIVACRP